jgi:hypothetical protein
MKYNITIFVIAIYFFFSFTTTKKTNLDYNLIDSYQIGDITYSILSPEKFLNLHGNSWAHLNGQSIKGSNLEKEFATQLKDGSLLPNGNGLFIRSMNNFNNPNIGFDPIKPRAIGSLQKNDLQNHFHSISQNIEQLDSRPPNDDPGWINCCSGTYFADIAMKDGDQWETRPENITLYCYIKIN